MAGVERYFRVAIHVFAHSRCQVCVARFSYDGEQQQRRYSMSVPHFICCVSRKYLCKCASNVRILLSQTIRTFFNKPYLIYMSQMPILWSINISYGLHFNVVSKNVPALVQRTKTRNRKSHKSQITAHVFVSLCIAFHSM